MVVILSSYIAIALGVILLVAGLLARHSEQSYGRYLLAGGGLLLAVGILGILWFMAAFS